MKVVLEIRYPLDFPVSKIDICIESSEGLDKRHSRELRELIEYFQNDKASDLFLVTELITRVKEFLVQKKKNFENLVTQKEIRMRENNKAKDLDQKVRIENFSDLKIIVETENEMDSSGKTQDENRDSQVGSNRQKQYVLK